VDAEGHTVRWTDGLTVVRVMTVKRQIMLRIRWQGRETYLRLGPIVAEITSTQREETDRG
jgi:hypothetical protein